MDFFVENDILVILGLMTFWSFDEWGYFGNLIIKGYLVISVQWVILVELVVTWDNY